MLLSLLAESDGGTALGILIGALSGALVAILGAWGMYRSKLLAASSAATAVLTEAQIKEREANAEIDRKARKDERDELRSMLKASKEDREKDREEIHDCRDKLQLANLRMTLAEERLRVCDEDRQRLREDLVDLRAAVEQHGIQVKYRERSGPVVMHGPDGSEGEPTVE